jgi:hypothetical protein
VPWVARISASPGWHGSAQPGTAQEAVAAKPVRRLDPAAGDPTRPRTWSRRWRWPHSARSRSAAHRAHRPSAAWSLACPDRPGLRRSGPPFTARRRKESTLTRSRSIRPGGTEFVQQPPPEAARTPGAGPLVQALPAGGGRAAAQLLGWQQAPRRRGAGHEDERGDAVAVRHAARDAAARAGRRWRQQRLDALPQLGRKESVDNGGHTRASPPWLDRPKPSSRTVPDRPLNRSRPAARPASMTAMGCGPVWRMPSR